MWRLRYQRHLPASSYLKSFRPENRLETRLDSRVYEYRTNLTRLIVMRVEARDELLQGCACQNKNIKLEPMLEPRPGRRTVLRALNSIGRPSSTTPTVRRPTGAIRTGTCTAAGTARRACRRGRAGRQCTSAAAGSAGRTVSRRRVMATARAEAPSRAAAPSTASSSSPSTSFVRAPQLASLPAVQPSLSDEPQAT